MLSKQSEEGSFYESFSSCLIVLFCTVLGSESAVWYSVTLVKFSLEAEQVAMRGLLELSNCGDEGLCQDCVKWGLPTCWVQCNANRIASASWRAVICN